MGMGISGGSDAYEIGKLQKAVENFDESSRKLSKAIIFLAIVQTALLIYQIFFKP